LLDPLSGKIYEIATTKTDTGCKFENAVLADYPFIIVERETIKFN